MNDLLGRITRGLIDAGAFEDLDRLLDQLELTLMRWGDRGADRPSLRALAFDVIRLREQAATSSPEFSAATHATFCRRFGRSMVQRIK